MPGAAAGSKPKTGKESQFSARRVAAHVNSSHLVPLRLPTPATCEPSPKVPVEILSGQEACPWVPVPAIRRSKISAQSQAAAAPRRVVSGGKSKAPNGSVDPKDACLDRRKPVTSLVTSRVLGRLRNRSGERTMVLCELLETLFRRP